MNLSEFSLNKPVTAIMLTVCVVVLGIVALKKLPLEQYPSISSSGIRVTAQYNSSSPEEVERRITIPLEATLGTLSNIASIASSSSRNAATVRVNFKPGTDMDMANMELRERVDQARAFMPEDIGRISLRRWQADQRPIIYANMAWLGAGNRLVEIIQKVVEPRLLRLDGVADVAIDDLEAKQLIVELDEQRLQSHNISLTSLSTQMSQNNINLSLGRVMDGHQRYLVRSVNEFQHPNEIARLPIPGGLFRLQDIGQVNYGYPPKTRIERLNGVESAEVEIFKSSTANVVEMGQIVVAELDRIRDDYKGKLDIAIVRNRADYVLREVNTLIDSALLGALLAMGIIFVFLRNIRSTLVVALAIPTSALCVFIGMYIGREVFGSTITLNMVSMMGLMLAVGMLVDPAVVVLESIFRKRQEEGLPAHKAALVGSREVGMAVLASSLTTICVFVPFFFLNDSRSATWMRDAGVAICLAVMVSMLVSLTVIPLATSRLFKKSWERYDGALKGIVLALLALLAVWQLKGVGLASVWDWSVRWYGFIGGSLGTMPWTGWLALVVLVGLLVGVGVSAKRHGLRTAYAHLLNWTLDHRWAALVTTVGLTWAGYYFYNNIEHQGTPRTAERQVEISLRIDRSYTLEEIGQLFTTIEDSLLAHKEALDIESLGTRFSQRSGRVRAYLVDADDGHLSSQQASDTIKAMLPQKVGITYTVGRRRGWRGSSLGVEVQLSGHNPEVLAVLMEEVKTRMVAVPGVQDVDSSLEDGTEEIRVVVDRAQALGYGLSPRQIGQGISQALGTRRTSGFKSDDWEIDIVMRLNEGDRATLDQLKNSRVESDDGTFVQLGALADFRMQRGPRDLQREDRQLQVTVFANTADRKQAGKVRAQVQQIMEAMELPSGYSWELGRASRWSQESTQDTNFTALFAILLIYLIMASLFESFIHPFTIILAIPFSLIGVALGLYVMDVAFDDNASLGLLILFGIVVNNGIVLIDQVNRLRASGLPRRQAIIEGGQHRLRPILMTAFTTILNLMPLVLPMIYGTAEGFSRRWGPVGLVVVSGLITSTLLTLVLAPTLYAMLDDLALWLKGVVRTAHQLRPVSEKIT
jgi:HAE1 family hydrophobic/amphiphilic exporter-1